VPTGIIERRVASIAAISDAAGVDAAHAAAPVSMLLKIEKIPRNRLQELQA